ncbi:hypothetical protein D3C86_1714960 [compost metagenome]
MREKNCKKKAGESRIRMKETKKKGQRPFFDVGLMKTLSQCGRRRSRHRRRRRYGRRRRSRRRRRHCRHRSRRRRRSRHRYGEGGVP